MRNLATNPKAKQKQGFTQFELVNYLLQNLYKWDLTPIEQLVLLQLAYHYNPANKFVFPRQKTLAQKINVSERSIVRAIQKLVKDGLILVVCGLSNKYVLAPKLTAELAQNEKIFEQDNMSAGNVQNSLNSDTMSPTLIEQTKEPINEPLEIDDYRILKQYALNHKARNVNAYINALKQSGNAHKILAEYHQVSKRYETGEVAKCIAMNNEERETVPPDYFAKVRSKLL